MKSDAELLQAFARNRSEEAFALLVRRHVDLVYSAALRQVNGDFHLAQDVAQRVFIDLARKAKALGQRDSLVGWLYTCAHHAACNAVRGEQRRRQHEQEAQAMHEIDRSDAHSPSWEQLGPVLDAAMLELPETDREAVLRRYFAGESFAAIGAALATSEEAARKRVDRALDRLHRLLTRRGITSGASALALVISENAVIAAPMGVGTTILHSVLASSLPAAAGVALLNKLIPVASAIVAACLVVALVVQQTERSILTRELESQRNERVHLEAILDRAEKSIGTTRLKLAALARLDSIEGTKTDPQPPITDMERVRLDPTFAALFQRLQLERSTLSALKDLLVLRERRDRETRAIASRAGLKVNDLWWNDVVDLRRVGTKDIDNAIGALIGDTALEYFREYERTLPQRQILGDLNRILDAIGESLTPTQADQLVFLAKEGTPDSLVPEISDQIVARAASILTPVQLKHLRTVQAARSALANLLEMNRAAAVKGLLNLQPASAREVADWVEKSHARRSATVPLTP